MDGLRGVAIALVVLFHLVSFQNSGGALGKLAAACFRSLWIGVDLFFVLSGYLITGILLNTRDRPGYFRRFYIRRALRIFPLYYAVVGACLLLALSGHAPENLGIPRSPRVYLPVLTYLTNCCVFDGDYGKFGALHVFWSLAVEEHFYLIWPTIVLVCPTPRLVYACLGVCVASVAVRAAFLAAHAPSIAVYDFSFCRFDALAFGAIANLSIRRYSVAPFFRPAVVGTGLAAFGGLVVLGAAGSPSGLNETSTRVQFLGFSLIGLFMATMVVLAVLGGARNPVSRCCQSSPLRWLGKYSYGIYVLHGFVLRWVNAHLSADTLSARVGSHALASVVRWAVFLCLTICAAITSWYAIERPLVNWKDALAPETPRERDVVAAPGVPTT